MKRRWYDEIEALIVENIGLSRKARRGRPRLVKEATVSDRETRIRGITRDLQELGMLPESVEYFKEKHVIALVGFWESKHYAAKTLHNKLSALRMLLDWLGKRRQFRDPGTLLADHERFRLRYTPPETRSWSHKGIDPTEIIGKVMEIDPHVGYQLRAIHEFGLSRMEALRLKPCRADKGEFLSVADGTRGRRDRAVAPLTASQRALLDELKRFVEFAPERSLCQPGRTLRQARRRFHHVLEKAGLTRKQLGVTAWGLAQDYRSNGPPP